MNELPMSINGVPVKLTEVGTVKVKTVSVLYHKPKYKKVWNKQKRVELIKSKEYLAFVVDGMFGDKTIIMHPEVYEKMKKAR